MLLRDLLGGVVQCLLGHRARLDAQGAAHAVQRGNSHGILVGRLDDRLGGKARVGRRTGSLLLVHGERTDGGVRADERTGVALDAVLGEPLRHHHGDAALLVGGGTLDEGTVRVVGERGNRQLVACHGSDGIQQIVDGIHEIGTGTGRRRLGGVIGAGLPCLGHVNLDKGIRAGINGGIVEIHHCLSLLDVGLVRHLLHVLDSLCRGQDVGEREESGLQDGVLDLDIADLLGGDIRRVDDVEADVVVGDVLLDLGGQMRIQLIRRPGAVEQEGAARLDIGHHVVLVQVRLVVAGDEVRLVDVVGGLDGRITEAQVRDGDTACLLGVVLEVRLDVFVGVVTDDLDGVLVGADGAVSAQTPELAGDGAGRRGIGRGLLLQRVVGDVIHDADGELCLGLVLGEVLVHGEDGSGGRILGTEAVASADDTDTGHAGGSQCGDDIQVQRLTQRAGLLGAVQNRNLLHGSGDRLDQLGSHERAVQANLDKTDLLAVGVHVVDDLLGHVADRAHCDDDAIRIGCAVVVEQLIIGAQLGVDLVHVLLDDGRQGVVVTVARLAVLEEDIAVLVGAAQDGMLGVERALAEGIHGVHIQHFGEIRVIPHLDLLDLVGRAEAVEEVDERDAALDGSQMCDGAEVHDLLRVGFSQHGETGLAAGVHVGVISEDVECLRSHAACGHMEHAGEQLTGDLVHIGDHQEQTLRRGVGGGQRARTQRAVDGTCRARLGLHFHHLDGGAEDVLESLCGPLVHFTQYTGYSG